MTTTLTFKVPRELALRLEAAAASKRITKSKYVRDILAVALKKDSAEPNLHDLMKEHLGCFDGPTDLSSNPKYMKGYGKWRK